MRFVALKFVIPLSFLFFFFGNIFKFVYAEDTDPKKFCPVIISDLKDSKEIIVESDQDLRIGTGVAGARRNYAQEIMTSPDFENVIAAQQAIAKIIAGHPKSLMAAKQGLQKISTFQFNAFLNLRDWGAKGSNEITPESYRMMKSSFLSYAKSVYAVMKRYTHLKDMEDLLHDLSERLHAMSEITEEPDWDI
jgi:hypothetical protein